MYLVTPFTGLVYNGGASLQTATPSRFLPVIAAALGLSIFAIDTFTKLDVGVAVLYMLVVLLAASFSTARGIVWWSAGCMILTLISYGLRHSSEPGGTLAVVRGTMGLLAIGITAVLAVKFRRTTDVLMEKAKAFQRSETYLADAQKLSRTGSFTYNAATGEMSWSNETYRIFDYDPATLPNVKLWTARTHPDDLHILSEVLEGRAQGSRESVDLHYRLLMPDGRIKHIRVVSHPSAHQGGSFEYVGAIMDMTVAKHAEEALFESQAALAHAARITTLGELTASIAHEVNQPLTGIIINGEVCLRLCDQKPVQLDELRGAIEDMLADSRRASEVIRRLRALSRKETPKHGPLDLNEVMRETLPLVRREFVNHRVSLKLDLAPHLPAVLGDRVQLQQVVTNLVINAIQAMSRVSDRTREVSIRSGRNEEGVFLAVSDTGTGIAPENMKKVFGAFFTTKASGMGVGLAICRSIIEAHEGRIWASNNDGHGATFHVILPVKREEGQ